MMLRFFGGALVAIAVAWVSTSCANLADVTPSCGNGVVEPGEDCDQQDHTTSGDACGAPGTAAACRYVCSYGAPGTLCPTGFACGTDGLCRAPKPLEFSEASDVATEGRAKSLVVDDFNGDGVDDLIAVTAGSVDEWLFDASRTASPGTSIIQSDPRPSVGKLTFASTSSAADAGTGDTFHPPNVAMPLSGGVSVFTGDSTELVPESYASVAGPGAVTGVAYKKLGGALTGFVAYDPTGIRVVDAKAGIGQNEPFGGQDTPVGLAAAAPFLTSVDQCWQVALALDAPVGGHVAVYDPCAGATPNLVADVHFPAGQGLVTFCGVPAMPGMPLQPCAPVTALDVNQDGHPDLLVAGSDGKLYVAYSNGKGFYPDAAFLGMASSMSELGKLPGAKLPLAIADLNADCAVDIVDANGIFLASATSPSCAPGMVNEPTYLLPEAAPGTGKSWANAIVGDVNGDAWPEVTITTAASTGLEVLRNLQGSHFLPVEIPTFSTVKAVAVGDFDGDGIGDVVYAEQGEAASQDAATDDSVSIAYGTSSGPPEDPVPLGDVLGVSQILATPDFPANAYVASVNPPSGAVETSVYPFVGNTSREIVAPFVLLQNVQDTKDTLNYDVPLRVAVGAFRGDPANGDIAVLAHPVRACAATGGCATRLWLLPTSGDATMTPTTKTCTTGAPCPASLPAPFDDPLGDAVLGRFEPPGGHEEIVLAAPDGSGKTSLLVAAASDVSFVPGTPTTVPFDITQTIGKLVEIDVGLTTANVDGSGLDLVLGSPTSGVAVVAWDAGSKSFSDVVASATYADLLAALSSCTGTSTTTGAGGAPYVGPAPLGPSMPRVSGDTVRVAPWPSATYVKRLLAQNPDAARPRQSLMIVTPGGVVLASYDTTQKGNLDLTCVATSQADDATLLTGGYAIGTGDFDGDGIDDIAVSDDTGITVYYGNSYDAGHAPAASASDAGAP